MKLETFYTELLSRFDMSETPDKEYEEAIIRATAETIDAMTDGKLFAGIDQIAEDWKWPE